MSSKSKAGLDKKHFLLCYDIREDKRLLKLHKYMVSELMPVQRSVFYGFINECSINRIIEETLELIEANADDVRVYRVAEISKALTLGTNQRDMNTMDWGIYFAENK